MHIEEGKNFIIICGDAQKVAPQKVQIIVSDPPYRLTSGGDTEGGLHERIGGEEYSNKGDIVDCDIDWSDIAQINYNWLEAGKHAYIMANNRNVEDMLVEHRKAGFSFHNLLVWHKRSMTPNRWYMKDCEYIGFFYKKSSFAINNCSSKQLVSMPQVDVSKHPTEKPVLLMRHYIENSSQPGETVFDPFAGSGTTGVAALQSGRKFIGIEKNEQWFQVMHDRLREEESDLQQTVLF